MKTRFIQALPVLVVAALLAVVTSAPLLPLGLASIATFAALIGPRVSVDRATQRLFAIVVAILSVAIHNALAEPAATSRLHPFWIGVSIAVVLIASFRAVCTDVDGGYRGTVAVSTLGLIACGETRIGTIYIVFVVLFVAATIGALRSCDPNRPPLRMLGARSWFIGIAIVFSSLGLAVVTTAPLRPIADVLYRRLNAAYDQAYASRGGGFSDTMRLGRLDKMLRSDVIALRLYGPETDLLRAVVFDRYEDGHFTQAPGSESVLTDVKKGSLPHPRAVLVTRGSRENDRIFLPLGAGDVSTIGGQVRRDGFGAMRATSLQNAKRYWFRAPTADELRALPSPTPRDFELPDHLVKALTTIATEWRGDEKDPTAILARFDEHLRKDYAYALGRNHDRGRDPVLHFLEIDKSGHCEYFAAAMVLLARASGIPARFVSGFRVSERNPLGGHYVVREKNAHSWVEAWTDRDGWKTWDPTPMAEGMPNRAHDEELGAATGDMLVVLWERTEAWLAERTIMELGIAAALGTGLFALIRRLRNRTTEAPAAPDPFGVQEPSDPAFVAMLETLAISGHLRRASESIERFATRIGDPIAAALLTRYAAHRYGGASDPELANEMRAFVRDYSAAARADHAA